MVSFMVFEGFPVETGHVHPLTSSEFAAGNLRWLVADLR